MFCKNGTFCFAVYNYTADNKQKEESYLQKKRLPLWYAKERVSSIYIQLKQFIYIPASS